MKKILIFWFLLCFGTASASLAQAQVRFFQGTWSEAVAEAHKQNKPIFVDFYTTWCGPCKLMTKSTFANVQVGDYASLNYIAYKADCEKGEGIKLAEKFEVDTYPTIGFFDKNGNLVKKEIGYKSAEDFLDLLKATK